MLVKFSAIGLVLCTACLIAEPDPLGAAEATTKESATSATVIPGLAVRGILGRAVQDADGKEMGRVIDVVVDPLGHVRAAIIDFGGFFGVGSRKIAVSWNALQFGDTVKREGDIKLELGRDQLKAAPEYKDGNAVVVSGSAGSLEPLNFPASKPEN